MRNPLPFFLPTSPADDGYPASTASTSMTRFSDDSRLPRQEEHLAEIRGYHYRASKLEIRGQESTINMQIGFAWPLLCFALVVPTARAFFRHTLHLRYCFKPRQPPLDSPQNLSSECLWELYPRLFRLAY